MKTFIFAIATSLVFLSCGNDIEQNDRPLSSSDIQSSSSNVQASSSFELSSSSKITVSSSSFEVTEMPIWSSRVISYKRFLGMSGGTRFITDGDTLKLWFPHIFNEEQRDGNCNYFAILLSSSPSLEYFILSQDMILYRVSPYYWQYHDSYKGECAVIAMPASDTMLICDDTPERNLKDIINLDYASWPRYTYPGWDCREEDEYDRGVFF